VSSWRGFRQVAEKPLRGHSGRRESGDPESGNIDNGWIPGSAFQAAPE
jgi:hypothetical protein